MATIAAHSGSPVLALQSLSDGRVLSQGKEGTVKLWSLDRPSEPLRTYQTHSYTFCKMQAVEPADGSPLLMLPCEAASNLALMDLRAPPTDPPAQLIECEARVPRDEAAEEQFMSRLDEKELQELQALLAQRPVQYERKVGIVMAAKFFQPPSSAGADASAAGPNAASSSSCSSSSSSSSAVGPCSLPDLKVAWASESGIFGVWDIRAAKHLFQQSLHKDTSQCNQGQG